MKRVSAAASMSRRVKQRLDDHEFMRALVAGALSGSRSFQAGGMSFTKGRRNG